MHVLSLLKKLTPVLTENITSPAKMNEVTQSASRLKWGLHVNVFFSAHSPLSTGSTTPAPSNYHVRRLSFIFYFSFLVLWEVYIDIIFLLLPWSFVGTCNHLDLLLSSRKTLKYILINIFCGPKRTFLTPIQPRFWRNFQQSTAGRFNVDK